MFEKYYLIFLLLIIALIPQCKINRTPLEIDSLDSKKITFITKDNLYFELDSVNDSYTLTQNISGLFLYCNNSDSIIFPMHGTPPIFRYSIYNEEMELIDSYPKYRGRTWYNFNFKPGDSFLGQIG